MNTDTHQQQLLQELQNTDEERELYRLANVTLIRGTSDQGQGELVLTSKNVRWTGESYQLCISFLKVGLSAIMRNTEQPCLYCQVDKLPEDVSSTSNGNGNNNSENGGGDEDEEDENEHHVFEDDSFTELKFIPTNNSNLTEIYDNFCLGALLNPEPETSDGEGELYYGGNNQMEQDDDEDYEEFQDGDDQDDDDQDIDMLKPDQVDDLVRYQNPDEE
ncbi:hypothetical protein PPL_00480 [Heterostelium album PN500]|uniref:Methylosome subunit pICln n=1 Tax=Heterostelium pallidum (strain ATCC 26659 / Pp 5 / PN500) TaxID=670386 RepID=D3AWK5_HETP5|nr:hypothetical protein PPL_00480 [Heterostelium album PN500]EFA86678.1 hypothetical protein PPL_00480 [Heterostelium album PN500]|eukprot:XP_020438782.1 hypothetical protein PPL_00480 [Heterostelium album PN500]